MERPRQVDNHRCWHEEGADWDWELEKRWKNWKFQREMSGLRERGKTGESNHGASLGIQVVIDSFSSSSPRVLCHDLLTVALVCLSPLPSEGWEVCRGQPGCHWSSENNLSLLRQKAQISTQLCETNHWCDQQLAGFFNFIQTKPLNTYSSIHKLYLEFNQEPKLVQIL